MEGFQSEADENCAALGFNAACGGDSWQMFRQEGNYKLYRNVGEEPPSHAA
jgi:hypothetical protein